MGHGTDYFTSPPKEGRWIDDVVADLRVMKIKQWTEKAEYREQWRLVVKRAKAHPGL
jgi:hypothetical protein